MAGGHPWTRRLYSAALLALAPLLWWRVWREHRAGRSRGERLGWIPASSDADRPLWLHCASVGEVQAAQPLIEALRKRYPQHRLVITTMTATGAERAVALAEAASDEAGGEVSHYFLPLDFPCAARRFVARLRPRLAIFFETELWPNLLASCARRGVPVAVVNGRLSARSFRTYRRLRRLMQEALSHVDWLGAKSRQDAERFAALGMAEDATSVTGSLKFDIALNDEAFKVSERLHTLLGGRPVWVAGSTHPGEDEALLTAHARVREIRSEALLILVPRHPRRFEAVAELCAARGLACARRSKGEAPGSETAVYLGDTMGELRALYGAADLAFVGGSLVPVGGHNLLEPAAMGVPVLTGPELANFEDVAETLREHQALVEVADGEALAAALLRLFDEPAERQRLAEAGRTVVEANRGALARTLDGLETLLSR
ncbi:lipid IV(A) 3-deoxy-D-manno-octulosonic acid transferase [Halomonas elongata]|uniref:3-deoxy-D-manno-octulosonic acid transferase n=1 Tax=Halomonas elongata (strain ATCC 33173 / DSM 2581 / NBRC 15536 / NCIMB 2198 / 1H9) TaxID=768066 RepID=E1V465_HALED|nr:lipid IV(A) 3-deoxy-D-manno-octulosonic acid transferase [Halomonas elongata]WBF18144.1 lipid IV(A) 3-deoxy-D-manno-octulosonic acid transferase [Halomonas elongata]WPU46996.1 lipid IV(A) 3-deoxy-D-manno-octulosonic acid transferase [Halomonas elongata DSM 2581]CBV40902.1 3-deoxy-D-manno-octulosonic-acid transferase [Halomonas elongata DSM 2581]